jgi:hypothetical protein
MPWSWPWRARQVVHIENKGPAATTAWVWNLGKARHKDPRFQALERLRPLRLARLRFRQAATATGMREEYNYSFPVAHTLAPTDHIQALFDHIRASAADILVLVEYNPAKAGYKDSAIGR